MIVLITQYVNFFKEITNGKQLFVRKKKLTKT